MTELTPGQRDGLADMKDRVAAVYVALEALAEPERGADPHQGFAASLRRGVRQLDDAVYDT